MKLLQQQNKNRNKSKTDLVRQGNLDSLKRYSVFMNINHSMSDRTTGKLFILCRSKYNIAFQRKRL